MMPAPTAPPPSELSHTRFTPNSTNQLAPLLGTMSLTSTMKHTDGNATPVGQFGTAEEEEIAETMEFCRQLREQVVVLKMVKSV